MGRLPAVVALIMLCVLGACGDEDQPAASNDGASSSAPKEDGGETRIMDVCGTISVDDVGAILEATVTSKMGPFDACQYDQEDPRATSASIDSQALAELGGGYDGFKSGSSSVLTDSETVDLKGVGDQAFISTGQFGGGESTQLQGAVVVGGQLISVNLTQGSGIEASVLVDQATKLLTLVAAKA